METTITTCDRCGKTEKEDTASWSQLWVNDERRHTTIDLCDQCAKALLGWVQSGPATQTTAEIRQTYAGHRDSGTR